MVCNCVKRGVKCPQNRDLESLQNRERKVHFFAQELARSEVRSSATNGQKSDKLKGTGAEDRALLESNPSVAPVTVGRGSGLSDRRTCCLNRTLPMVPKAKNSKVSQRNEQRLWLRWSVLRCTFDRKISGLGWDRPPEQPGFAFLLEAITFSFNIKGGRVV